MKLVVAAARLTPILCWRASGLESPTEVPASTLPERGIAPVRANIASRRVVLPLWKGPTSAMHRGPWGLLTSCPIAASLVGARPLIGSAAGCSASRQDLASWKNGGEGPVLGPRAKRRPEYTLPHRLTQHYLPGRSSRLSSPAATFRPTWPCTLSGCSAIELSEPPISTLPPTPTPTDALPWAPASLPER